LEKAPDAFALLSRAQADLLDEEKRGNFLCIVEDARQTLLAQKKLKADDPETYTDEFLAELRKGTNRLIVEIEHRKKVLVKRELEEEGRKAAELERAMAERKRKLEADKEWESTRYYFFFFDKLSYNLTFFLSDTRVASWRDFQTNKKKKGSSDLKPPKLATEDASKGFIKRPAKFGGEAL